MNDRWIHNWNGQILLFLSKVNRHNRGLSHMQKYAMWYKSKDCEVQCTENSKSLQGNELEFYVHNIKWLNGENMSQNND